MEVYRCKGLDDLDKEMLRRLLDNYGTGIMLKRLSLPQLSGGNIERFSSSGHRWSHAPKQNFRHVAKTTTALKG
jgi:hypothetical protein